MKNLSFFIKVKKMSATFWKSIRIRMEKKGYSTIF